MTLVLLDTNAYLRFAKRIKPLLGIEFAQKKYVLTILKDVEKEVHRNIRLKFLFPWFDDPELSQERLAKRLRLSKEESDRIEDATSILRAHVLEKTETYISGGRSPPSRTDCYCLAFGQIRPAVVVTDDIGMHQLADDFEIAVWHGHELLKKMLTAKIIDKNMVHSIYEALENNDDLPKSWRERKYTSFKKVFGKRP